MTKQLRNAIRRIRKAQDAVFEHKVEICHCLELDASTIVYSGGSESEYWTVYAHRKGDKSVGSWMFDNSDTQEALDEVLRELSDYIGFEV